MRQQGIREIGFGHIEVYLINTYGSMVLTSLYMLMYVLLTGAGTGFRRCHGRSEPKTGLTTSNRAEPAPFLRLSLNRFVHYRKGTLQTLGHSGANDSQSISWLVAGSQAP